jgi:hypothetical protein
MSKKVRIIFADDVKLDRRVLKASLRRLAPEFEVSEHSQGATLLSRLLRFKIPPRLVILDRAFTQNQIQRSRYSQEMITLAQHIRRNCPQLSGMAILIYSCHFTETEAADFSDRHKGQGIWARTKTVDHKLLVQHLRHIVSQWPQAAR